MADTKRYFKSKRNKDGVITAGEKAATRFENQGFEEVTKDGKAKNGGKQGES